MSEYIEQIVDEVKALAIANAERGIASKPQDVALESFFDGAEDLNTPENRSRLYYAYLITHRRHTQILNSQKGNN